MNEPRMGTLSILSTTVRCFTLVVAIMPITLAWAAPDSRSQRIAPAFVTEKGPHHRTWSRVTEEVQRNGRVLSSTNTAYVELRNGMHYWEGSQWKESRAEIEIADGFAIARYGPHKVRFAADFTAPTLIDVTTPDNKRIRSRILGLAYASRASGRSVLIAEPRQRDGEVLGNDRVIYRDAFDGGFRASAVYRWSPGGIEQDIVLSEMPPAPAEYQLMDDPSDVSLEVWTEILNPIEPGRRPAVLERQTDPAKRAAMVEPDLMDETLDFGAMIITLGAAFMSEADVDRDDEEHLVVAKSWVVNEEGRRFLVERVPYTQLKAQLDRLPPAGAAAVPRKGPAGAAMAFAGDAPGKRIARQFPTRSAAQAAMSVKAPMRMAMTSRPESGFVIDYNLVGTLANFTFKADTTYWVSNGVQVSFSGTTRLEGAVIKFGSTGNSRLKIDGPLECLTSEYSPAFFVGKDDDSVGSPINGSSGQPGYTNYAGRALDLYAVGQNHDLKHLRFRNCVVPIRVTQGTLVLSHSTVTRSKHFVETYASPLTTRFRNVLAYEVTGLAWSSSHGKSSLHTNIFENATFHRIGTLRSNNPVMLLTNSLIISVTNSVAYSGAYNFSNLVDTGIFRTVGAGAHYLTDAYLDQGTPNIDPTLVAALRQRTTQPPMVIEGERLHSLSLTNMVARDSGAIDQGFHYSPLDVVLHQTVVTNDFVTALPGMVLGVYGPAGTSGIQIRDRGALNLEGFPTNLTRIVRYNLVQEQASTNWAASSAGASISLTNYNALNVASSAAFRFVHWAAPAGGGRHIQGDPGGGVSRSPAFVQDCQFVGGSIFTQGAATAFKNCLFERVQMSVYSLTSDFRNCTVFGGNWMVAGTNGIHQAYDNLFYETSIDANHFGTINHHNAYLTNQTRLAPNAANDIILTSLTFNSGPLGRFYLPTNCPLINTSSVPNASTVGMYHMTTVNNGLRETNSVLDCGFHYVCTGTNGLPADADGDLIPDYVEDANNNGVAEADELSWLVFHSDRDYDGRTDAQEAADYTLPDDPSSVTRVRLGYWRFNLITYPEEGSGELPNWINNQLTNASWSGTSAFVGPGRGVRYCEIGPDGAPNINCRNGTVRFWFKPKWTSASLGGTGPGFSSRLISLGKYHPHAGSNMWEIGVGPFGTNITFGIQSNGISTTHFDGPIQWVSNRWHQIALTYSPSNIALYLDGVITESTPILDTRPKIEGSAIRLATGEGIKFFPPARSRAAGFYVGTEQTGGVAVGDFDELETFNYPLTAQEIGADYPTFSGASYVTTDSDYDGRSDLLEAQVDGTNPNNATSAPSVRLAYFRFNLSTSWDEMLGEQGQKPIGFQDVSLVTGWSGHTLCIQTNLNSRLVYRDVENTGSANVNCRNGAVRFWFKPAWNSGSGPSSAPFLYLGNATDANAHWELGVQSQGSTITFHTASNNVGNTPFAVGHSFTAGKWYQVAFNYSPTAVELYVNDVLVTNRNVGVAAWPSLTDRTNGLVFGNNVAGNRPLDGQLDEVETFNTQLTAAEIKRSFYQVQSMDTDLNGVPDLLEDILLAQPRSFVGVPFTVTGCIEAEQFDAGGKGVAYTNVSLNNLTNDYRASGMEITNCNDLGGGYCVSLLQAGDWMKYTLDVRVAQTYAIEPRIEGLGTGGVFHIQFFTNFSSTTPYATTGPLTNTSTSWTNITSQRVGLVAGTNIMKVLMTNNGSSGYVGRLNYISIYPAWDEGVPNIGGNVVTISTNVLNAVDSWNAATNNAQRIQAALNSLTTNGAVVIPAGRWVVAQSVVDETKEAERNTAIVIPRSGVEIRGAGRTNTTLIAHNRATTIFYVGLNSVGDFVARTNITFRDFMIEGRPHVVVTSASGNTRWEAGALNATNRRTGTMIVARGNSAAELSVNLGLTNCAIHNPGSIAVNFFGKNSNCFVRNCEMICMDGTNGSYTGEISVPSAMTIPYPATAPPFYAQGDGCQNLVMTGNIFTGNPGLGPIYPLHFPAAEGIAVLQGPGNWFVARNVITNYALEGVQLNAGPSAVVGNIFITPLSSGSTAALDADASFASVTGVDADYSYSFIGNEVLGGRYGARGDGSTKPHILHVSGNRLTLVDLGYEYPGAVVLAKLMRANISGNTLVAGGHGVRWKEGATNAIVLKNDFGSAPYRALDYDGTNGAVRNVAILKNRLHQGVSFHLKLREPDARSFFLWNNTFTNHSTVTNLNPFTDSASAPVHFIR